MKTSKLLAATAASAALAFAPTTAFAYPGGGSDAVVVEDATPETCTFPATVDAGDAISVTLVVSDDDGNEVFSDTLIPGTDGSVTFAVDLGAGCAGSYSLLATDEFGGFLADGAVTVDDGADAGPTPGGPTTGGGDLGGDTDGGVDSAGGEQNVGGLPATGSSDTMLLSGLAGAGLLAGGSVLLMRRRRAAA